LNIEVLVRLNIGLFIVVEMADIKEDETKIDDRILVMVTCENLSCPNPPVVVNRCDVVMPLCKGCDHYHFCSRECQRVCWPMHKSQCQSGVLPKLRYTVILKNIMSNGPPANKNGNDLVILNRNETCSIEYEMARSAINFPFPKEFWEMVGERPGQVLIVRSLFIFIPCGFDFKTEVKVSEEEAKIEKVMGEYKLRVGALDNLGLAEDIIPRLAQILLDLYSLKSTWLFKIPHRIEENILPIIKAKWDRLAHKNEAYLIDNLINLAERMDVLSGPMFRIWVNKYMDIGKDTVHVVTL